jgi:DNA-binding NtrC family response regulator
VRVLSAVAEAGRRVTLGDTTLELSDPAEAPRVELAGTDRFGGLVGSSLLMRELYAILERAAGSDASVLLHGETGTGKELAAEAIHEESSRRDGPFVVVDCGAIPSTLFESELFGHVRGAFTGAIRDQTGLLVQASGGTIFLDEIGELLPELQPKLLRALERREVRPVGAGRSVGIDVRVIAATHRDLPTEVNRGTFREDLYFRLAVLRVRLPPLRARSEDVPRLVRLFVDRLAPERADDADEITATLAHRSFPGNVRELRNAVEELLVLGGFARRQPPGATRAEAGFAEELFDLSYKEASDAALQRFQREYVARLLARTSGNVSLAAREADMSRRYLQTLVARLGLSDTD